MAFRRSKHEYHDSQLESYEIGPRNELTLNIYLDPVLNKESNLENITVRFGAIKNIEEVKSFFAYIPHSAENGRFICEIIGIVNKEKDKWVIDLEGHGNVTIQSLKFNES